MDTTNTKQMVGVRMDKAQKVRSKKNAQAIGTTLSEYLRLCEEFAGPAVAASGRVVRADRPATRKQVEVYQDEQQMRCPNCEALAPAILLDGFMAITRCGVCEYSEIYK